MRILPASIAAKMAIVCYFILLNLVAQGQHSDYALLGTGSKPPVHLALVMANKKVAVTNRSIHAGETPSVSSTTETAFTANSERMFSGESTGIMILQIPPVQWGGAFTLKISSEQLQHIRVRIIDLKGRLIRRLGIKRDGTIIFVNNLNPGNYYIEAVQGNSKRVQRLFKK